MNREELKSLYIEEVKEHLEGISECLLRFDKNESDQECIHDLFRAVHTIKGSTSAMGFTKTAQLIHSMEDTMQEIRDGNHAMTSDLVAVFFSIHDFLEAFILELEAGGNEEHLDSEDLLGQLELLMKGFEDLEGGHSSPELVLEPSQLGYLVKQVKTGQIVLGIHVKINNKSSFTSIRVWMAIEEIKKHVEVVVCNPASPASEVLKSSEGESLSGAIDMIALSDLNQSELESLLKAELTELEVLYLEQLEVRENRLFGNLLGYDSKHNAYLFDEKRIMLLDLDLDHLEEKNQNVSVKTKYPNQFLNEIINTAKEVELVLLDIYPNETHIDQVNHISRGFHTITEFAIFCNHELILGISQETENIVEMVACDLIRFNEMIFKIIVNSLSFIKKIARCGDLDPPNSLQDDLFSHCELLKQGIIRYIDKSVSTASIKADGTHNKKICELLEDAGKISKAVVADAIELQKTRYPNLKMGQVLVKEEIVSLNDVREAIAIQEAGREQSKVTNYVKIPEIKLDILFDLLGELIILQSQQKECIANVLSGGDMLLLNSHTARIERVTRELQSIAMKLRLVSIKQTFQKILRIGRDTARDLGRNVNFEVNGEETEVDRSIVEKLNDPLMHLIRNAVSHGIEDSSTRTKAGKTAEGNVYITAYNKKGTVFISISDDGRGINLDRVLMKARATGLAQNDRTYSEDEIINMIFQPGISTAEEVDHISGRGVGMNVVESDIKKAGGKIEVATQKGGGSVFTLKLPINLATMNGIIVALCGQNYVLPAMNIKRIFKPEPCDWVTLHEKIELINNHDELIHLVAIGKILDQEMDLSDSIILVIELDGKLRALPVQEILGKQEIVIKPLDAIFNHLPFLSGSTILGDGQAALILDIESFFNSIS